MQTLQLLLVVLIQGIEGRRKNAQGEIDLMNKMHFIMNKCLDLSATSLPINSFSICNAFKHRPKPRNTAMAYEFQNLLRRLAMIK